MSRPLLTPNVCVLGTAALSQVPVGHAMGDDGKGYDLQGFFSTVLANAVARHVHGQADAQTQQVVFAAACIEMMRPLVPDLAQRAHELCFPEGDGAADEREWFVVQEDQTVRAYGLVFGPVPADIGALVTLEKFAFKTREGLDIYVIKGEGIPQDFLLAGTPDPLVYVDNPNATPPLAGWYIKGECLVESSRLASAVAFQTSGTDLGGQDFSAWLSPNGQYLQTTPPLQDLRDAGLRESITDDGEPQTLGHTLCFAYRGKSYSLNDHADYFGPGDLIRVLPAGTGDAVWAAVEGPLFGTYACCVQPIQMQEGARHV